MRRRVGTVAGKSRIATGTRKSSVTPVPNESAAATARASIVATPAQLPSNPASVQATPTAASVAR